MLEGQFYIRLILNVIVGMMFAYALYKMAKHNNQETTPVPHKAMYVIGCVFIGLSVLCLGVCIFYLTVVDFPQQLRGPFIGPNTIVRPTSSVFYWGYPTSIQNSTLTMALSTFDFLGIGAYFIYFKSSNSKWWKKASKFIVVLLLYAFMASATNFHYFDFPEFVAPILFFILWLFIVNRKESHKKTKVTTVGNSSICVENSENIVVNSLDIHTSKDILCNPIKEENQNHGKEMRLEDELLPMNEMNTDTICNEIKYCRHCGKEIESDSKFCKYCGMRSDFGHNIIPIIKRNLIGVIKYILNKCASGLNYIRAKCSCNNIVITKQLKKISKIISVLFAILVAVGGIGVTMWYYFDEIIPQKEGEQILLSERTILNRLNGIELCSKCKDIILHHRIPKCGKEWIDCDNLSELTKVAWQKIEELAYDGNAEAQFILGVKFGGYDFISQKWVIIYSEDGSQYIDGLYDNSNLDFDKAAYWYLKAAEQNHRGAQNNLANCYKYGNGVTKDIQMAIYWFKQSATNGDALGQLHYGDCFRDGYKKRVGEHWEKDTDSHYYSWEYKLGYHLVDDYEILIKQDLDSAKYYWQLSAAQGNETAKERLQKIY